MTEYPIPGEWIATDDMMSLVRAWPTPVEYWQPTMSLRWKHPYSGYDGPVGQPVLEQAWQSTTGKVEWRPVPREE
jgi:hypothetical protein